MRIEFIKDKELFIENFDMLKKIPFVDNTPEEVLGFCLTGKYYGYLGYKDNKVVAIVVFYTIDKLAFVVGLYARNNLKGLPDLFWEELKKNGIETARASTDQPIKDYGKRMGMEKICTMYERIL